MKQKIHLKKSKKPISRIKIFFFSILGSFCIAFFSIISMGNRLEKIIINYATIETNRIATAILNSVTRENNIIPDESLYTLTKDADGNIQLVDFNTKTTNQLLNNLNQEATKRLLALENGDTKDLNVSGGLKGANLTYLKKGVVCEIPLGSLLGNSLLVNFTSIIPIRFSFIGTVNSYLKTRITSYGINNALVEIIAEVTITEQITMPHTTKQIPVTTEVTLLVEMIQGKVPSIYQGSLDQNSHSLSLPITENS